MSKLDQFILITISFFIFLVLFIRIGFFIGIPINSYTFILALVVFLMGTINTYSLKNIFPTLAITNYLPVFTFIIFIIIMSVASAFLSYTYDTSWDGQGYHQTAVIALANNWNPAWDPSIDFAQNLPSQIFAEGYPSSLWEIEASIYSLSGKINSAKVVNIAVAIIAGLIFYSLLRKLKIEKITSILISFLVVLQPVYIIQLLTFMEDGLGYELLVIAVASLAITAISSKSYWAITTFIMSELLLVTIKYSHLPVSAVLGFIFLLIIGNRFLNREYRLNKYTYSFITGVLFISLIFAYIPYLRNQIFHSTMFYPTNIPELMGSVKYNNVPNNLQDSNKLSLLFYGLFSKAQPQESGDPTNPSNLAHLKIPFTFTDNELVSSAQLYNNRVGSGGPLFSGLVILSFLLLTILYFNTKNRSQRYAVYVSIFSFALILILALLAPTPNLLRYTNQLQLLPFAVIIPVLAIYKNPYIKLFCLIIIALSAINFALFSSAVAEKAFAETRSMNEQMNQLRSSGKHYQVKAQQFYSTYTLLKEQNVPFSAVTKLNCNGVKPLYASSTTTQYCF